MSAKTSVSRPMPAIACSRGVDILNNAVKITLGPEGRNVVMEKSFGAPRITKDGVTVAKEIEVSDKFENRRAALARSRLQAKRCSRRWNHHGGHSRRLGRQGRHQGGRGRPQPDDLKRGIDLAVNAIVADLKTNSKKVTSNEEIAQVGTISANGDKSIGEMIANAMQKVGNEGVITVEEARASRPNSISSKACSSTVVISRPILSPTPRR